MLKLKMYKKRWRVYVNEFSTEKYILFIGLESNSYKSSEDRMILS